ncbi:MAG: flagellar basal body P-ring formation chaperone FlgA [Pseudomonadota bacterium]
MKYKNFFSKKNFFILAIFLTSPSYPNETRQNIDDIMIVALESTKHITQQTSNNISESIHLEAGHIDPRLKLVACLNTLNANHLGSNSLQSRFSVEVSCSNPRWRIIVPIYAQWPKKVFRLTKSIERNQAIHLGDLEMIEIDILRQPNGVITKLDELKEKVAKRRLNSGSVLQPGMVEFKKIIEKNQSVIIEANSNNFSVKMTGVALQSGARGEIIQARNSRSDRIVEGEIIETGRIRVRY